MCSKIRIDRFNTILERCKIEFLKPVNYNFLQQIPNFKKKIIIKIGKSPKYIIEIKDITKTNLQAIQPENKQVNALIRLIKLIHFLKKMRKGL